MVGLSLVPGHDALWGKGDDLGLEQKVEVIGGRSDYRRLHYCACVNAFNLV